MAHSPPAEWTDTDLVNRIRSGDREALEELHSRYYTRLYRAIHLRLESSEAAADVTQETFLRALEHLETLVLPAGASLFPWLYTIAKHAIIDMHRAGGQITVVSLDAPLAGEVRAFIDLVPNGRPTPEGVLEQHAVQAVVRRIIRTLPEDQYTALTYRYLGGLSLVQISRQMDKSIPAVKSLLHRAFVNVKRKLTAWDSTKEDRHARKPRTQRDHRTPVELRR